MQDIWTFLDILRNTGDYDIPDEELDRLHTESWNQYEAQRDEEEWEEAERDRELAAEREQERQEWEIETYGYVLPEFFPGMPYDLYRETWKWRRVRAVAFYKYGKACQVCKRQNELQIHHRTYEHLYDEIRHMSELAVLCDQCHAAHHAGLLDVEKLVPRSTDRILPQ